MVYFFFYLKEIIQYVSCKEYIQKKKLASGQQIEKIKQRLSVCYNHSSYYYDNFKKKK